ncbi:MAG TPA: lytic murein transglycosylase [Candidatus Paceibacterota bacterium]|nr:lytic murein transglycosylase [Candidatus Paceibacterota bacterium]
MMRKAFIFILIIAISFSTSIDSLVGLPSSVLAQVTSAEERAQLEAELRVLEQEIKEKEAILKSQQQKTGTLKKDVALLTSQIETAKLKIRAKTIAINKLGQEINQKSKAINDLESEIGRERSSMAQLIKKTNEIDQKGATYVLLSSDSVSDFYQDLDDFLSVKQSLYASVNKIKQIKSLTEDQKEQLESKKEDELDAKNSLDYQKKIVEQTEKEKKDLLKISQSKEQEYQAVLKERQKRVTEIRNKLFSFAGGNTKAIPFAQAYEYAEAASAKTGVRTAFILAILTQESNLGKNVGTCNRAGDPPSKSWKNVMSPTRDQAPFKRITEALGLNPDTTPVSCPIAGGGWGGAMGPAQFIPSTWESVAEEVASDLGVSIANPWRAQDAIMASAVYLKRRGAVGGESAERNAACRYYSGRSCDGKRPPNSFYGNNVMAIARSVQSDIDYLKQYGVSRR